MSLVRTTALLRNIARVRSAPNARNMSGGPYSYRVLEHKPPKHIENAATVVGALTWWWILWGIWSEPGHIFGEFPYPDPSKWTDQELGIPPDDAE